jgi:hypothetical protein
MHSLLCRLTGASASSGAGVLPCAAIDLDQPVVPNTQGTAAPFALLGRVSLVFQPISKPAVNNFPLLANRTEIKKVRPFFL